MSKSNTTHEILEMVNFKLGTVDLEFGKVIIITMQTVVAPLADAILILFNLKIKSK